MPTSKFGLLAIIFTALPHVASAQEPSISIGRATTTISGLIDCGKGTRVSAVGEITSQDGQVWIVPADTHFQTGPKAVDLYNECGDIELGALSELDLSTVPVANAGGSEEFTAYIFADNYFELYVNGNLIAVDPVPFTPFNSNVVRFTAQRPVTLAVMGVDWEENLGLGSEAGRGSNFFPGDAGIVAHIQDASGDTVALTNSGWKAQTFYTSPLPDPTCLIVDGETRDSSACSTEAVNDATSFAGAHWPLPEGWMQPDFDDGAWPAALTFSNETVGVDNKPGYTNFTDIFDTPGADAEFIWSSNLVLDNLVLLRVTIE